MGSADLRLRVLALIVYFALLFFALHFLAPVDAALAILAVDPYAKMVSAQVIQMMPYARTEETAKRNICQTIARLRRLASP